jgi:hypothetical protein
VSRGLGDVYKRQRGKGLRIPPPPIILKAGFTEAEMMKICGPFFSTRKVHTVRMPLLA